jgi:putative acyl-CoA dehydrogenase
VNRFATHTVENQPPPLAGYNTYASDPALHEAIVREGAGWAEERCLAYGALAGSELIELGEQANRNAPVLRTHDRYGHRLDEVDFHPAYHRIMTIAMAHGVHALPWQLKREGSHVARAALEYLHHQAEAGTNCPLTMTYASVPALTHAPALAARWLPKIAGSEYDPRGLPMMAKSAVTLGMGMTEKQGGSDVRANTTQAQRQTDGSYVLVGHKWFFSAPMSDAFLVLAQAPDGLSCFLMPRFLDNGERNAVRIQRLKDKLGNRSNASSEVEFHDALAWRVGDEGRGVATILQMVALTRLDCMIGSAAEMRQALVHAVHHTRYRRAFGRRLIEQPLMRNVLADLALESEAALVLAMRTARAIDRAVDGPHETALARLLTPIGKYWICKRAPVFVNEAQECLGGAGYVEESMLPRLYREAPLNSIWEGCGNVQCLDLLRALTREPACREALQAEFERVRGEHASLDAAIARVEALLAQTARQPDETGARALTENLALTLQGVLLVAAGNATVAAAFVRSRLQERHALAFGTLPTDASLDAIIERAFPDMMSP